MSGKFPSYVFTMMIFTVIILGQFFIPGLSAQVTTTAPPPPMTTMNASSDNNNQTGGSNNATSTNNTSSGDSGGGQNNNITRTISLPNEGGNNGGNATTAAPTKTKEIESPPPLTRTMTKTLLVEDTQAPAKKISRTLTAPLLTTTALPTVPRNTTPPPTMDADDLFGVSYSYFAAMMLTMPVKNFNPDSFKSQMLANALLNPSEYERQIILLGYCGYASTELPLNWATLLCENFARDETLDVTMVRFTFSVNNDYLNFTEKNIAKSSLPLMLNSGGEPLYSILPYQPMSPGTTRQQPGLVTRVSRKAASPVGILFLFIIFALMIFVIYYMVTICAKDAEKEAREARETTAATGVQGGGAGDAYVVTGDQIPHRTDPTGNLYDDDEEMEARDTPEVPPRISPTTIPTPSQAHWNAAQPEAHTPNPVPVARAASHPYNQTNMFSPKEDSEQEVHTVKNPNVVDPLPMQQHPGETYQPMTSGTAPPVQPHHFSLRQHATPQQGEGDAGVTSVNANAHHPPPAQEEKLREVVSAHSTQYHQQDSSAAKPSPIAFHGLFHNATNTAVDVDGSKSTQPHQQTTTTTVGNIGGGVTPSGGIQPTMNDPWGQKPKAVNSDGGSLQSGPVHHVDPVEEALHFPPKLQSLLVADDKKDDHVQLMGSGNPEGENKGLTQQPAASNTDTAVDFSGLYSNPQLRGEEQPSAHSATEEANSHHHRPNLTINTNFEKK